MGARSRRRDPLVTKEALKRIARRPPLPALVAKHRSKDVLLYRQGGINFIVNREPHSAAAYFAAEHGASACGLAFRVKDSHKAYARALELVTSDSERRFLERRLSEVRAK